MGMYTELYLRCELRQETPKDVISLLREMVMGDHEVPDTTPFGDGRRPWMLRSCSHYHFPFAKSSMDYIDLFDSWYLFVRCDLKNYDDEIGDFLRWVAPYINAYEGDYLGHTRYEEDRVPEHLIYGEGYLRPSLAEQYAAAREEMAVLHDKKEG